MYSVDRVFTKLGVYDLANEENNMKIRLFLAFIYQMVVLVTGLVFWDFYNCGIRQIARLEVFHISAFIFYELIMKLHFLLNCSSSGSR